MILYSDDGTDDVEVIEALCMLAYVAFDVDNDVDVCIILYWPKIRRQERS